MPKTVFVTGCSSGIGRATADVFANRGWNVMATAREAGSLAAWEGASNRAVFRLDVTDEATIASAVQATVERFGTIDVVVNNAGYGLFGPIEGATAQQLETLFRTNVLGMAAVIRHALPVMRQQRNGTIVNMSSIGGRLATPYCSAYYSTKFAIEGLSESLRFELKPHGIRVKIIEPAHFKTDFLTRSLQVAPHPAYEPQFGRMMAGAARMAARATHGPERVAEAIFRAANDSSGRLRYPVNGRIILALHALLPDLLWRSLIGLSLKAPKQKTPTEAIAL
jgi:NAD(P)-dependent dehydrogenase (short-subunit alcohol dehydrogenase family)